MRNITKIGFVTFLIAGAMLVLNPLLGGNVDDFNEPGSHSWAPRSGHVLRGSNMSGSLEEITEESPSSESSPVASSLFGNVSPASNQDDTSEKNDVQSITDEEIEIEQFENELLGGLDSLLD